MTVQYIHEASEPDFDKPVIMCSFCNEQNLVVMPGVQSHKVVFLCNPCDYEWEWDTRTLEWDGYSLENGRWDEDWKEYAASR